MTPQTISLSEAGSTAWIPVDYKQNPFNIGISLIFSNTANIICKVEYTLDNIFDSSITPTAFTHTSLSNIISNNTGNITYPVRAIRLTILNWVSGTVTLTALQGVVNPQIYISPVSNTDIDSTEILLIPNTTWYVSNVADNEWAIGLDINDGLSISTPRLTLASAYASAVNGDKIVINSSVTPYNASFYLIEKSITIEPWSWRGVTLQTTNATYGYRVHTNNVTFGSVIIDTNGVAPYGIYADQPSNGLRLIGTKIISHGSYSLLTWGSVECSGGFQTESVGASKSKISLRATSALDQTFLTGCIIDGPIDCAPTGSGVNFKLIECDIVADGTYGVQIAGAKSVLIEKSSVLSIATGVSVVAHATLVTDSVIIRDNTLEQVGIGTSAVGYGIGVGKETAGATTISYVDIYRNTLNHCNHGIFTGYGTVSAHVYRNVVRDSVIGLISKGGLNARIHSNVVIGGTLTGGALRSKGATGAHFYNNLVLFDAQSVAGAFFAFADASSSNAVFANNILYAPGVSVWRCGNIETGSTASFYSNDYFCSFLTTSFYIGTTYYANLPAWQAAKEPTAMSVDPLFVDIGDYRLSESSTLRTSGTPGFSGEDFYGGNLGLQLGPMPIL